MRRIGMTKATEATKRNAEEYASQRLHPRVWSSLYQQRPAPEEGAYFKREWLKFYRSDPLKPFSVPGVPLRLYGASDYAVTDIYMSDAYEAQKGVFQAEIPEYILRSKPVSMQRALRHLREKYGAAADYLRQNQRQYST